jgi:putative ABC transport system substrate-binding protein
MTVSRRQLLVLGAACGALLVCAPSALPQQRAERRRIGFIGTVVPTSDVRQFTVDHLWRALRDLGWQEGRNFVLVERWAEGNLDRLPSLAAEVVAANVDVIVVGLPDAAVAAKQATHTIPIVTVLTFDPVRHGLIASYARPGGNVTGLSYDAGGTLGEKLLDLLKQALPRLSRVAILWNPDSRMQSFWLEDMQPAARALKLELLSFPARSGDDLAPAFRQMKERRAEAVVAYADVMLFLHREALAGLALEHRLPSISALHEFPHVGGLLGYVADIPDSYRRAARFVDLVLRGANPAELAVEQPTKFRLTVNLKTARALKLRLPEALLVRADEVIK